ncbi:hypothetical protein CJ030_MR0G006814 [Morella rubra]|uniref:Uncharacterized protein n=1 Tax=Morella rubra TaxID=262757 RepID=A0A6A1UKD6_9ROSI|nr:hypothetical protein CJ030_MR0G006814 [Morella rubra]
MVKMIMHHGRSISEYNNAYVGGFVENVGNVEVDYLTVLDLEGIPVDVGPISTDGVREEVHGMGSGSVGGGMRTTVKGDGDTEDNSEEWLTVDKEDKIISDFHEFNDAGSDLYDSDCNSVKIAKEAGVRRG